MVYSSVACCQRIANDKGRWHQQSQIFLKVMEFRATVSREGATRLSPKLRENSVLDLSVVRRNCRDLFQLSRNGQKLGAARLLP
jgi:hypothetical protein